jgi:hypothetical protein
MPISPNAEAGNTGPDMPAGKAVVAIDPALVVQSGVDSKPPAPLSPSALPNPLKAPPPPPKPKEESPFKPKV